MEKSLFFDIDVIGGLHLKKKFGKQALAIFVQPPSLDILIHRLRSRGTDSEDKLKERIAKADKELKFSSEFDIILENDNLEDACIQAEKLVESFYTNNLMVNE